MAALPFDAAFAALTPPTEIGAFMILDALPPSPLVRRIQEALQGLGDYRGPANGRLDDDTVAAIRAYQKRAGLDDDGRPSEELVTHLEFTYRAVELSARLDAVRSEQMRAAEAALLARPETRVLVTRRPIDERADPTRDPTGCFAAPTQACLLNEASESAKGIFDARFRDWVLGEIVVGMARAGLAEQAFDTAGRIADPRLIIAALRDIAVARAEGGQIDQALAVASFIPDDVARGKALAAVALAQVRAGATAGLARTVGEIADVARRMPAERTPIAFLAETAIPLSRAGAQDVADQLLALAHSMTASANDVDSARSAVAAARAAIGQEDEALALLTALESGANHRPVLAALAGAAARRGDAAAARAFAERIGEARYRATTLAELAAIVGARQGIVAASPLFDLALVDARSLDDRPMFARSNALRAIALAMAQVGMSAEALELTAGIPDTRMRAEALWATGAALAADADLIGAERVRQHALADTAAINSALDRAWVLCGSVTASARAGDTLGARQLFSRALEEAKGIADAWARAQAMTRVATTLGSLGVTR